MKKLRKVKPGARKRARKEAQKQLEEHASLMLNHPMECCICEAEFVRTQATVKTWQVVVRESRVRLTCPECWTKFMEGLEKVNNEP